MHIPIKYQLKSISRSAVAGMASLRCCWTSEAYQARQLFQGQLKQTKQ
jgi:hypothetical protein